MKAPLPRGGSLVAQIGRKRDHLYRSTVLRAAACQPRRSGVSVELVITHKFLVLDLGVLIHKLGWGVVVDNPGLVPRWAYEQNTRSS
jgi:hypothetical protein